MFPSILELSLSSGASHSRSTLPLILLFSLNENIQNANNNTLAGVYVWHAESSTIRLIWFWANYVKSTTQSVSSQKLYFSLAHSCCSDHVIHSNGDNIKPVWGGVYDPVSRLVSIRRRRKRSFFRGKINSSKNYALTWQVGISCTRMRSMLLAMSESIGRTVTQSQMLREMW